jgi:hypothetical protein
MQQSPIFKAAAIFSSPPSTKEVEEAEDATDAMEAEDEAAADAAHPSSPRPLSLFLFPSSNRKGGRLEKAFVRELT